MHFSEKASVGITRLSKRSGVQKKGLRIPAVHRYSSSPQKTFQLQAANNRINSSPSRKIMRMQFGKFTYTALTHTATVGNCSACSSACGTYPYCPENFTACLCDFDRDGKSPTAKQEVSGPRNSIHLSIFHQRIRRLLRLLVPTRPPVGTHPSISDLSAGEQTEANRA